MREGINAMRAARLADRRALANALFEHFGVTAEHVADVAAAAVLATDSKA